MLNEQGRQDSRRGGTLGRLKLWGGIAVALAIAGFLWVKFDLSAPTATLRQPVEYVGQRAEIQLDLADRGTGLSSVEVAIDAGGTHFVLLSEDYPSTSWRGSRILEKSLALPIAPRDAKIPEGSGTLVVEALDGSWRNYLGVRPPVLSQPITIDYTPPTVEVLTGQHYMRLGGSDLVVYKTSKDAVRSGVAADRYFFPGVKGILPDADVAGAFFAVPQDLTTATRPKVVAEDAAGNRREVDFFTAVKPRVFQERSIEVGDDFLKRKVPDLLLANHLPPNDDLVAAYLQINRELRKTSEEKVREVCSRSEPSKLWTEPFLRQPNSAPLSSFADRRTYTHAGKVIDHQTHLGFDLASLRLAPVVASNKGKVSFADDLGIYGSTVILDHGLGLFSLYGHLSSIGVTVGQEVARGDALGRTGETGLDAGDHLHFSIMVDGVHVDPVEWWDPKWIQDHVNGKLEAFLHPAAVTAPVEPSRPARRSRRR